ncbi:unnamed protein product [Rhizoctonia solani]|uniref:CFEM domain-containing protein n=1 Tax=Rhizoctonia solani TaxID=456999 RepID=A0A8H3E0J1_9AGAM|nr:unnamed protein product [Rhizoctonia solani]
MVHLSSSTPIKHISTHETRATPQQLQSMYSPLLITLSVLLFAIFGLARDVDQVVLGDMLPFKPFEPTPTIAPVNPINEDFTQDEIISSPRTTPTPSAAPPSGGGATCAQGCLARAATQVRCGGSGDFRCVCNKSEYVGQARACFDQSRCAGSDIGQALEHLDIACRSPRRFAAGGGIPESPMVAPEGTPAVAFGSSRFDEL